MLVEYQVTFTLSLVHLQLISNLLECSKCVFIIFLDSSKVDFYCATRVIGEWKIVGG